MQQPHAMARHAGLDRHASLAMTAVRDGLLSSSSWYKKTRELLRFAEGLGDGRGTRGIRGRAGETARACRCPRVTTLAKASVHARDIVRHSHHESQAVMRTYPRRRHRGGVHLGRAPGGAITGKGPATTVQQRGTMRPSSHRSRGRACDCVCPSAHCCGLQQEEPPRAATANPAVRSLLWTCSSQFGADKEESHEVGSRFAYSGPGRFSSRR